jgi:nucleotide-binding universal stress UspA family protein
MALVPGVSPAIAYLATAGTKDTTRSEIQLAFDSLPPRLGWRLEFCEGPIGPTLVERSESADALVVGTREHTGIGRVLNGSVSHYCMSHAKCPILAVPPQPETAHGGASELSESVIHR